MAVSYPSSWIERVEAAEKLALDPIRGVFVSPDGVQAVRAEAVEERTRTYLKAEAARRKKRLTKDDERLCRAFVLLVANWRTGAWDQGRNALEPISPAKRRRKAPSASAR